MSRSHTIRTIRIGIISIVILAILGYIIWRSFDFLIGPKITIISPTDGASIASTTVTITGKAERLTKTSLNGSPLFIDEVGNFNQTLIVFPGYNAFTFEGTDRFGRSVQSILRLVGTVTFPHINRTSTSVASSTTR